MFVTIMFIALCVGQVLTRKYTPGHSCRPCTRDKSCRVVTDCPTRDSCTLSVECIKSRLSPHYPSRRCLIGEPILVKKDYYYNDLTCGRAMPCPDATYCSTGTMDTPSVCCISDHDTH